jgi:hypothetical protein
MSAVSEERTYKKRKLAYPNNELLSDEAYSLENTP